MSTAVQVSVTCIAVFFINKVNYKMTEIVYSNIIKMKVE